MMRKRGWDKNDWPDARSSEGAVPFLAAVFIVPEMTDRFHAANRFLPGSTDSLGSSFRPNP